MMMALISGQLGVGAVVICVYIVFCQILGYNFIRAGIILLRCICEESIYEESIYEESIYEESIYEESIHRGIENKYIAGHYNREKE